MKIRTYLLILVVLAGVSGFLLSFAQQLTGARRQSVQDSVFRVTQFNEQVELLNNSVETLNLNLVEVFVYNRPVLNGYRKNITAIQEQLEKLAEAAQAFSGLRRDEVPPGSYIGSLIVQLTDLDRLLEQAENLKDQEPELELPQGMLLADLLDNLQAVVGDQSQFYQEAKMAFKSHQTESPNEVNLKDLSQIINKIIDKEAEAQGLLNAIMIQVPRKHPLGEKYDSLIDSTNENVSSLEEWSSRSLKQAELKALQTDQTNRRLLTWTSVAFVILLFFGFWWGARRISSPLLQLSEAAEKAVQSGEPYQVQPAGALEIQNLNHSLVHLTHSLEDLVETRNRQLVVAEAEMRKLSHVASRISDGVIITNKDGLVDWVNEGFILQSGYQLKEIKGHKPGLLLQGARTDPSTIARMHERLQAGEGFIVQLVNYTKQQQPYWVQLEVQPVYDRDRQLSNYIGVARNITRDKQELRDQRLETIGNVASGLAHDLNNILAPITLSIEMLKETYPESDEMVDTIEQCATRASFMVQQLLNYVKGQAGALSIFDLSEVLNETLDLLRFTLPKRVSLHYEPLPTPTQIHGDSTQVQQLLINLAVNARDAMPDGGKLSLSAREVELSSEDFKEMILCSEKAKPGRYGLISLADEGTGIEPSHVERIFEPFFTTKSPEEGTGLGLAAVAGIIKGHNGLIHVESQLGEGTTFMIYLPISIDQEEVKDTSAA